MNRILAASLVLLAVGFAKEESTKDRIEALDKFTKTIQIVQEAYVDKEGINDIVNKAIAGLLSNLDAHSSFLDSKSYSGLQAVTDGEFGGLGIQVGLKDGAITVIAPIENTPADKAGLKASDIILKINNESTIGMSIDDAISRMRGKPKTTITLTIYRKGEKKPIVYKITRDIIKTPSVYSKRIEKEPYLYVRVTNFDKNVASSVKKALSASNNIKGVVLDLRNNPGGLVNQSVELSRLFIKRGTIVTQKYRRDGDSTSYSANGSAPYADMPLVILINGGSASASEIVAGAMQDHKRALLIGENTFGKGSVQSIIPLNKTEALKLTIAKYYLPSGRTIQSKGLVPDIVVHPGSVQNADEDALAIREADLKNHLQAEIDKLDSKNDKKSKETNKDDITKEAILKDMQLKSAIDVLRAWNIIGNKR